MRTDPSRRRGAGRRICVHGDYDVDGIAATTLAVLLLRELGADVAWHLPSRFDEGYGVRSETLARLADEGCGLVLTVDCGITAVDEVAEARERGLDVVVTDHHRPGETLPDCPVVATRPSEYPFPELCGTGVVYKLGQALFGLDSEVPQASSRPRRARDDRRRRPARRREPIARHRRSARPRAHREARSARAHAERRSRSGHGRRRGRRLPARAPPERRRTPRAPARGARAAPHRGRGGGAPPRRLARGAEPRAPGRRGPDPPRGRRPGRGVAARSARPPCIRRRRRRLARGRDRHRRLASRRALPPPGRAHRRHRRRLEGIRPVDRRPSTCTPRSARAPACSGAGAATARPPASRSPRRTSTRSPKPSPSRPRRCSPRRTSSR